MRVEKRYVAPRRAGPVGFQLFDRMRDKPLDFGLETRDEAVRLRERLNALTRLWTPKKLAR